MSPSHKKPAQKIQPHPVKIPKSAPDPNVNKRKLELRWSFFDPKNWKKDGSPCIRPTVELLKFFQTMETRFWGDVFQKPDRDHAIPTEKLPEPARERLTELRMDDIDQLWSFHVTSQIERIWGVRVEHELRILWWDPEHQVYPTSKKNT